MINSLFGDRYKLGEMIGTGGMADVYVAEDTRLARQVAIKVLRSDLARDPSFVARFRKEALAAAALNHPGIVAVYDSGEEPAPYIVMELISGHTLRELIHKGERVPLKRALEIGEGILGALEYSHHSGIVHRDIKPANIMITDDGSVKVMDFGIARAVSDATGNLEQTASILGTALYISPEQARGDEPDTRTDLYSLGVVMYELLSGKPPFTADSPVAIAYKHISSIPAPLIEVAPGVSPEVIAVVECALKKELDERFATAQAFRAALEDIAQGHPPRLPIAGARIRVEPAVTGSVPTASVESSYRKPIEGFELLEARGIKQESVPTLAVALGSLLAVLLVVGIVLWVFTLNPATTATNAAPQVPELTSQTEAVATQTLSTLGLNPQVEYEASSTVPEGIVIRTIPTSGIRVGPGEPVRLIVSSGVKSFALGDLRNIDIEQARAEIEAQGLIVGEVIETYSPSLTAGTVMATTPEVDSPMRPGDTVTITVSNGLVLVPNVVGLTVGEANPFLTGPSMQLSVRLELATDCLGQTVKSQSLTPGEHPQRSEITLVYCGGVSPEAPAPVG